MIWCYFSGIVDLKNVFGVVIRVIGLLACSVGLNDLLYVILVAVGSLEVSVTKPFPRADLVYGIVFFFIGLDFVRGAPLVLQFAYPETDEASAVEEDSN